VADGYHVAYRLRWFLKDYPEQADNQSSTSAGLIAPIKYKRLVNPKSPKVADNARGSAQLSAVRLWRTSQQFP